MEEAETGTKFVGERLQKARALQIHILESPLKLAFCVQGSTWTFQTTTWAPAQIDNGLERKAPSALTKTIKKTETKKKKKNN